MSERASLSLIQLDIEMPRKGGIEATRDIRSMEASGRLSSRIPIIAVSANARSGQIESVRHDSLGSTSIFASFCRVISADWTDARRRHGRIC